MLEPGQVVKVYERPLTQEDLEGLARLINSTDVYPHDGMEYWEVMFIGDQDQTYYRWITREEE